MVRNESDEEGNNVKTKILKKGMAGLLTFALIIAMLMGCGGTEKSSSDGDSISNNTNDSTSSGTTKLTMTWWGNQVRNERTQEALDKYSEIVPGVSIEGQFFQWDDYWSKLATSSAGNNMPDLIQMDIAYMDQYVGKEQLLDLTPYIESGAIDVSNISETGKEMGQINDKTYAFAAGVNCMALYYNKTVLDGIGITIEDNTTYEEFVEIAKTVFKETGYRANLISNGNYMTSWSRGHGINITEPKMGAETAEEYVDYFALLADGLADGWHLSVDLFSSSIEQDPMVYGSSPDTMSWCTVDGSNLLTAYQDASNEGVELAMTTVPTDNVMLSNYLKPSMLFAVSATTENQDEAVAVLNYLINSVEANEILLGERGVPISTAIVEAISPKLSTTEEAVMAYINDVITPNCSPFGPPDPTGTSEVIDLLKNLEEKVGYGEYTPEQAAEEYFTKGNKIFAEY